MVRTVGRRLSQPQPRRLLWCEEPTSCLSPWPPGPQCGGKSLGGCPTEHAQALIPGSKPITLGRHSGPGRACFMSCFL
ncbi:hypothetical protein CesoFtcFv8_006000 [Champsocephalus esox]|uniref:Uncharacterized protein n=1 Tax=Champsocephalus esox TaxID=159716 RepID=A0AAN8H9G1_9TELE|nr:hypothetical protein CesoFtcFv8_006000 [Champsocephalus esox]